MTTPTPSPDSDLENEALLAIGGDERGVSYNITGDFNSAPGSAPHSYLTNGKVS